MIKLEPGQNLCYIENSGCDDTTHGLAIMTDSEFTKFKEIIENLNKNSTYGCMPTIEVYMVDLDFIEEYDEEKSDDYKLYLNDKVYMLNVHRYWNEIVSEKRKEYRVI